MYFERVLFVDLTARRSWVETVESARLQPTLSGVGLGTKLLYDNLPAGTPPASARERPGIRARRVRWHASGHR